ncbi:MAG: hypothetical protein HY316_01745 [Acidobacteria bacterium]|nr:hypothetical protein [Acidobacteriota bacterium]
MEADEKREFRKLVNPGWWVLGVLKFVIQIPFRLVSLSGFDVGKVEDHFLAKVFKLAEVIFILFVLWKLGIERTRLVDIVAGLLSK